MTKKFQIVKSVGKNKVEAWAPDSDEIYSENQLLFWPSFERDINKVNFEILSNVREFEHVDSNEVSTDVDFYIKYVHGNKVGRKCKLKNQLNGKYIYGIKTLLRNQRTVSAYQVDPFTDPNSMFLKDIIPMILSKDPPTKLLGYQWVLQNINHDQMCVLHNLFKLNVYPYCEIHGKKVTVFSYGVSNFLGISSKDTPSGDYFKTGDELTAYQAIAEQIIKIRASQRPRA